MSKKKGYFFSFTTFKLLFVFHFRWLIEFETCMEGTPTQTHKQEIQFEINFLKRQLSSTCAGNVALLQLQSSVCHGRRTDRRTGETVSLSKPHYFNLPSYSQSGMPLKTTPGMASRVMRCTNCDRAPWQ